MRKTGSEAVDATSRSRFPRRDEDVASTFSPADYGIAGVCAAAALCVYLSTLAPTVTGEDSGELIAAAYTLGIPHPPGYPLWTMLAHLFTYLPWGTVAWRVNLVSAVFAAAAVGVLALLLVALLRGKQEKRGGVWIAAAGGALVFAFSREFWEQAVIAEVYTLNAFFFALFLLILWRWRETRGDRLLIIFAVLYGLSLGGHNTMHLLGPLFALYVVATERAGLRRWAFYGGLTLIAFLAALLVYAYLPLRSRADPPVDWGNPETLSNWWAVVRRSQYNFMLTQYPRSWARFARQMQAMGGLWSREFTPVLGMVGAAGLLVLLRRHFWYTLWLVAAGLYLVVAFTVAQNFNLDKEWLWVMSVFGIPAYLIMAMGIGGVLGLVQRWLGRWAAGAAALICIAVPLVNHWEHNDKSDYYWAEDYGRNTLESLPPNALYFPGPDHASFSALYLQVVEGLRPDVTLGRKYGYLDLPEAPELRDKFGEFPRRRDEPEILGWYLTHTERPLYFSDYVRLAGAPGVHLGPAGLLCRAVRPGETRETRDDWAEYRWHTLAPGDTRGDYTAELILYEIDYARAREAMARGQYAAGLAALDRGLSRYGREYTVLNNAGVLCARFGQRAAARMYFEEALRLPGQDGATRENLQGLQELLSQP